MRVLIRVQKKLLKTDFTGGARTILTYNLLAELESVGAEANAASIGHSVGYWIRGPSRVSIFFRDYRGVLKLSTPRYINVI